MSSCQNCRFLKVQNFTFAELKDKYREVLGKCEITEGYYLKFLNASRQYKYPVEKTRLKFMYCAKGELKRFYIIRHNRSYNYKKSNSFCNTYTPSTESGDPA